MIQDDNTEVARTPKYQLVGKYLLRKSGPSRAFIFGYEKDKVETRPLDDDEFLRAHWIMYFHYARQEANQLKSFLLEEEFTPGKAAAGKLAVDYIQRYVVSLHRAVQAWHGISFPNLAPELPDSVRSGLDRLNRVGRGAFGPLAMSTIIAFGCLERRNIPTFPRSQAP